MIPFFSTTKFLTFFSKNRSDSPLSARRKQRICYNEICSKLARRLLFALCYRTNEVVYKTISSVKKNLCEGIEKAVYNTKNSHYSSILYYPSFSSLPFNKIRKIIFPVWNISNFLRFQKTSIKQNSKSNYTASDPKIFPSEFEFLVKSFKNFYDIEFSLNFRVQRVCY